METAKDVLTLGELVQAGWPIIALFAIPCLAGVVWAVRQEGRINALCHGVNGVKQDSASQWGFITEDRKELGGVKERLRGLQKDAEVAKDTAARVEMDFKGHVSERKNTVERIWADIEDLKVRLAEMGGKAGRVR